MCAEEEGMRARGKQRREMRNITHILISISFSSSLFSQSASVDKADNLEYDVGNLSAYDPAPIEDK